MSVLCLCINFGGYGYSWLSYGSQNNTLYLFGLNVKINDDQYFLTVIPDTEPVKKTARKSPLLPNKEPIRVSEEMSNISDEWL